MNMKTADVSNEYKKDSKLKPEDVKSLQDWMQMQPHLPQIKDIQAILFLQSCYYNNEIAKQTIDTFFTMRGLVPEFFKDRNPHDKALIKYMNIAIHTPLKIKTPEGYTILFSKLVDSNVNAFNLASVIKLWDMMTMIHLNQEGTSEGHVIVLDFQGVVFGHLAKLGIVTIKKCLYYLQDGIPLRLKAMHFFNTVPFMDKILAIMKPFMKKELWDVLYLHDNVESLSKFVPMECLPSNYGGSARSILELHDEMKQIFMANSNFLAHEETMIADETRRPGKPKDVNQIFGVEGTFKKLAID